MNERLLRLGSVCLLGMLLASGCSRQAASDSKASERSVRSGIPVVYAVNYPLQYFASRIGGQAVSVVLPEESGFDPSGWEPDEDALAAFQAADLVLLNGADYAKWLHRASLRESRLVDTAAAFRDRFIPLTEGVSHSHGNQGPHSHEGVAFTTWLDPRLAVEQARAICRAFQKLSPAAAEAFETRFQALESDLLALDARLEKAVARQPELPLIASHPIYQYLQRRYGLNLHSLHWEPNEVPTGAMWDDLKEMLRDHPARYLIWEANPVSETTEILAGLGITSVVFPPCGGLPDTGNYLEIMQANADRMERIFGSPK